MGVDLAMAGACAGADLVHSHTWYANFGGHLASLLHGIPHVISAHSLEPLRPWKAEQLGGGYRLSSWVERTAYEAAEAVIAVSAGMRADILRSYPQIDPAKVHVVHNGIDSQLWQPRSDLDAVRDRGSTPTAARSSSSAGSPGRRGCPTCCAPSPSCPRTSRSSCSPAHRTPRRSRPRSRSSSRGLRETRDGVVWIPEMLKRADVIALLSSATVFACPSVYEPLGIVNLEAMACEVPVVATATGGIPEVVVDGETGWLVPIEQVEDGTGTPVDIDRFVADLAAALNDAVSDTDRARRFGRAGRRRAVDSFSWASIGDRTMEVYSGVLGGRG